MWSAEYLEKASSLQSWFIKQERTLALAESCTGGLLSSLFTSRPGASQFFNGAIVSYTEKIKNKLLEVPLSTLQVMGEVSTPTAVHMARGAKKNLYSDWAIAITGVAGPTGGTPEKPVGYVCFSVVGPGFEASKEKRFTAENRQKIQLESAQFAIDFLWDSIHA